mgnify:CR=1 FL=1
MASWRVLTTVDSTVPGAVPPVDVLALTREAARGLATAGKAKPGVRKATVHVCPHAAGAPASEWWNCRDDPRAQYQEM